MDIYASLKQQKALKPEFPKVVDRITILEVRPASEKLNFKTSTGEEFSRSNILFRYDSGELKGETQEVLFPEKWIVANGVTSFTGCEAWITQSVRKAKSDSKARVADPTGKAGIGKGDEVVGVSRIELTFNNVEAIARLGNAFVLPARN